MKLFKKFTAAALLSVFLVPVPSAQAATTFEAPTYDVIDNMLKAESVDFSMDIDVETASDNLDQPVKLHLDLEGVSSGENTAQFDAAFGSTDEFGVYQEVTGSAVITPEALYFADNNGEWYVVESASLSDAPAQTELKAQAEVMKAALQELFDAGVITYRFETVDYVNGALAVRYAYEIDNEQLVAYLIDKGLVPADEADDLASALSERVTMGGQVWIDVTEMLPVMFTFDVSVTSSETAYTNIHLSVLFNSFNERVDIDIPTNTVSFEQYSGNNSAEVMLMSAQKTVANMDTDGDGLTNDEEINIWGSDPYSIDTDGDGYLDQTEVINGYDPNGIGKLDSDADGLTDYNEMTIHWTDRFNPDSDGDSYPDGVEIANGYDPNGPGRF